MFKLIKAELIKILGKKSTKVSLIIIIILMAFSCLFQATSEVDSSNWRELVQKEVDFAKGEVEEAKGTDMEEFWAEFYAEDIKVGEYSLEHNISNDIVTPIRFAYDNTFCMTFWVILLLILAAINLSDEYQFGTIKQILTRPYKRSTILFVKQVVFLGISAVVLLVQMVMSYLVGLVFFGRNTSSDVALDYVNGEVIEVSMVTALWQTYLSYVVIVTFLMAIAYLFITLLRTTIMPVLISLAIWLCSDMVADLLSKYKIIRYTFFPHLDLTQYIRGNDLIREDNTIGLSLSVIAVTYIIVQLFTYKVFKNRDI